MSKLLAPNGKPSNLTPEQYKLVRTPEFKEWFGDWENDPENSSKVVDSNGEPLVVYHGTNAKFTIFDTDEESENRKGGIWNAEYPDGYIFMISDKKKAKFYGQRIIPLFVNLHYPTIKKVKKGESLVLPFDDEGLAYEGDAIVTDGIDYVVGTQDEFAVKLADGTNTTFDGNNPDIRFDGGGILGKRKKEILSSLSNYKTYDEWKIQNKSDYIYSQKNHFLREIKEHYGLEHKGSAKYTFDDALKDAKKYESYSDWSTTSRAMYDMARKMGWLSEIKNELNYIPQERKHTLESIIESAKRFGSYQEWRINSSTEYQISKINGWLDEIKNAIGYVKPDLSNTGLGKGKLTLESIIESTKEYDSYTEWRLKNESKYKKAIAEGWLDEIKQSFQYEKKGRKDRLESVIEKVKKYSSYTEWMKDDILTYQLATKRGWLQEIKNAIGYVESKYSLESIIENAKKYGSYQDWRENNVNEYGVSLRNNWIGEIKSAIGYKKEYTLESIIENAKKYGSYQDWRENNLNEYNFSARNNWLGEIKNAIGHKTKDVLIENAKKYKSYVEWIENNPNDFLKAHQKGYLKNIKKLFDSNEFKNGGEADEDEDDYYDLNYLTNFIYYNKKELSYLQNKRLILSPNEITEFKPSTHTKRFNDKPNGLWYAVGLEWFDFLKSNLSWESKYHYLYEINITDKVIRIDNMKDAISFSQKYGKYGKDMWGKKRCIEIDWRKVSKDWSGIEIINPRPMMDKQKEEHRLNPTEKPLDLAWMYSWDISSGCVWNNDGIIGIDLLIDFKNNKPKSVMDIHFNIGSNTQPRDLTQIENYRNIYKGAEFYTFSDNPEKVEKADRWFELFRTNQKERQLTAEEFVEFMQLSNELSWEEFSNGGGVEWDAERYRQVEREMYELRQQEKVDTPEYFKLIKERSILEQSKLKQTQNKDMETGHLDINTSYAKGGKILAKVVEVDGVENLVHDQLARFQRIGITDAYTIEAINEIGLQGVNFDEKTIIKRISAQFENLLNTYEDYIINEDSEAITFDMKNDIKTKKREGASLETLAKMENDVNNPIARQEKIDKIADGQKEALMTWVGYLRQSEYSVSFKCVMLNAVLKYNYDLNKNKLFERDNKTIRNFTPFDAGVLAQLYQSKSNFLLMDYTMIMNEQSKLVLNSREVIEESGNGKWVKFNGGKSTAEKIRIENARELSKLVQNTYWCTKNNAKSQLDGGDFYVYVTENNGEIIPRLAVRMEEQKVGEVRGNKNKDQAIEDEMLPIAEEFLLRNIPNDSGVRWLNSIYYNTRCIELTERIENEGFFKDFIDEYIKIVGGEQMFNTDYGRNGNVQLLKEVVKSKLENLPNEFFEVGDITDEISKFNRRTKYFIGDLDSYNMERVLVTYGINEDLNSWDLIGVSGSLDLTKTKNLGKIKIVGGNMTCGSDLQNLGNVTYVGGRLDISKNDLITSLDNIEHIGTSLEINKTEVDATTGANRKKSNLQNLGKLKVIYGNLTLLGVDETFDLGDLEHIKGNFSIGNGSGNIDLKNIKRIDGQCIIGLCEVTDLKNIEHIGTNFSIARSKVKVFDKLKFIGGNADFSNNFTTSTQNIETILGDVKFLNSRIMEFPKLKKVGGEMDMRGSYFKSLGNIKYIGGNLDLATSKLEDLGELQYVGGFVNFKGTKIENLNNLKKIVKFVNFEGSNVVDLGNLETIGGNAYFNNSKVESLGNLKYIGGFAQFHNKSQLEQQWLERSKK